MTDTSSTDRSTSSPGASLGLWILLAALLFGGWWFYSVSTDLPDIDDLHDLRPHQGLSIYAQDHTHLGGPQTIAPPDFEDLPPLLVATFLAAEDEDFFSHDGYHLRSIGRALFANLRAGETVQGASTITQQVAKHFLDRERTLERKLREFFLARKIEQTFSKKQILEAYLGGVYFGRSAFGVHQASRTYFDRPIQELSLDQMATLAGLLPAPSVYNPIDNPELSRRQRNRVLRRMRDVGLISPEDFQAAVDQPLSVPSPPPRPSTPIPEAHSTIVQALRHGYDADPEASIKVFTTHQLAHQAQARHTLEHTLEAHQKRLSIIPLPARVLDPPRLDQAIADFEATDRLHPARITDIDDEALSVHSPRGSLSIPIGPKDLSALQKGDLVLISIVDDQPSITSWPHHQGAMLRVDPLTGQALATVGAYDPVLSHYDRARQACRAPGDHLGDYTDRDCLTLPEVARIYSAHIPGALANAPTYISHIYDRRSGRIDDHGHFLQRGPHAVARVIRALNDPPPASTLAPSTLATPKDGPLFHYGAGDDTDFWAAALSPQALTVLWIGSDDHSQPTLEAQALFTDLKLQDALVF